MSIYEKVLEDQFEKLHPMLQYRYRSMGKRVFRGTGIMKTVKGGPKWLYPLFRFGVRWKLLFPESGENIPFLIKNSPRIGTNGEEQIHWERIFQFENQYRYFNALMKLDSKLPIINDYLGEPSRLYSDLIFHVEADGGLLIQSNKQRLIIGKLEIQLPKMLQGIATVREGYCDEKALYTIDVKVKNPIIGRVFSYEGVFKEDEDR
ncbi:DUF4166 domain-containing protein [Ornithinibacillus sp. JPR2-1]|uniref:DUF4166 domain-containing protein n=1 Tax=Ornithinibacillus sp. JPR2-1 TaxID=2094019 RepID=UPI0031D483AC